MTQSASSNAAAPLPLDVLDPDAGPLTTARQRQLIWALLAVGLMARAVRYFLRFPLWDDECFLMANLLERDYVGLTKPLNYWQICPVGFLWLELTLVKLFGFSEYVLRLPSFACSVAGLFVFRRMAGHLLRGSALVLAVGVFAVGYPLLRYSAEAKPYGIDLFLALALLAMAVEWWVKPSNRWLWALAVVVPVAVLISYPVVFVGGGVSLFVAYVLWRDRVRQGWLPWIVYNVALLAAFAVVFMLSVQPQSTTDLDSMRTYWDRGFPPLTNPLAFVAWFFTVHTGQMLAYPFGDNHGGSTLTFLLCVTAVALLVRRRQYTLLLLLLAPLGLTFVAAALGRYPYGGMVRFNIYMAPAFSLLTGLGLAAVLIHPRRRIVGGGRAGVLVATGLLAAVAVGSMVRDVARPAKTAVDMRFRDFSRWFWFDAAQQSELVCLKRDLGIDFSPETFHHGFSAMYLCNQQIYSPRHAHAETPRMDRVSADRPLRCVQFKTSEFNFDQAAFDRWLADMKKRYTLVDRDRYPFFCYDKWETHVRAEVAVEVYTFVPREKNRTAKHPTLVK
ncbi:MAG TPA: glycosyltransferase family 39 protein [Thermoguttaceae bacterium]|nr:glycosyltransferase family 39 protein [Thermoguttaceae bacterium]